MVARGGCLELKQRHQFDIVLCHAVVHDVSFVLKCCGKTFATECTVEGVTVANATVQLMAE